MESIVPLDNYTQDFIDEIFAMGESEDIEEAVLMYLCKVILILMILTIFGRGGAIGKGYCMVSFYKQDKRQIWITI